MFQQKVNLINVMQGTFCFMGASFSSNFTIISWQELSGIVLGRRKIVVPLKQLLNLRKYL